MLTPLVDALGVNIGVPVSPVNVRAPVPPVDRSRGEVTFAREHCGNMRGGLFVISGPARIMLCGIGTPLGQSTTSTCGTGAGPPRTPGAPPVKLDCAVDDHAQRALSLTPTRSWVSSLPPSMCDYAGSQLGDGLVDLVWRQGWRTRFVIGPRRAGPAALGVSAC